jgi:hypothetical protein
MMNLLGSFFLGQTGDRFEFFQVTFTVLNLMLFFPCYLISAVFWPRGRRRVAILAPLFALNPMIMENATYTWTKQLAAFYVVLGIWFYLAGLRKNDSVRMVAAFVAFAAGILVHYSAGTFVAFVALHYVIFRFWRRPQKWRELAIASLAGGALLMTWFGWSLAVYGSRTTFRAVSPVVSAMAYRGSHSESMAANLTNTLVPFPLNRGVPMQIFEQPSLAGRWRDMSFSIYEGNAILALGILGGPLALWLLVRAFRQGGPEVPFWAMFVPACLLLGVAMNGEPQRFGVAHITLQPLMALGLAFLASSVPQLRRWWILILIAGCAVGFALGVFLQNRVENIENAVEEPAFSIETSPQIRPVSSVLNETAWRNWYLKHRLGLCQTVLQQIGTTEDPAVQPFVRDCRSFDETLYGGWYSQHGGQMTFLGDRAAGLFDVISVPVVLMFFGWMAVLFHAVWFRSVPI